MSQEAEDKKLGNGKGIQFDILDKVNGLDDFEVPALNDDTGSGGKKTGEEEPEVVIRKVVKDNKSTSQKKETGEGGEEEPEEGLIIDYQGEAPDIGDNVTEDGEAPEDGEYVFTDDEGEETPIYVRNGKILAIGDDDIADLMKKVVTGGKVSKKKVPTVKKRMSAAQKAGLKKAQKKANTSSAKRQRAKSMKVRKQKLGNSTEPGNDSIDLQELEDGLIKAVWDHLQGQLDLDDEALDFLDENLPEEAFVPSLEDGTLSVELPVWISLEDDVELGDFDMKEFTVEIEDEMDTESVLEALTDGGENSISDKVIV